MTGFTDLLTYIEAETTFASSYYDDAYLDRRISARMRRTDADDYRAYLDVLQGDESEQDALLDTLSVNVTSFFRDTKVWEVLGDVLDDLAERRRKVDIWSAACADGREPYSITMLALDRGIPSSQFDVTATDIDDGALDRARNGVYRSTRTTDVEDQLSFLDDPTRFADQDGDNFRIAEEVREQVTYDRHDLITDDPKDGFDLVFCRNVCIYIDKQYKRPILETVSDSVADDGYLVLGQTETLPRDLKEGFEAADPRLRIYRRVEE
jgi:chemotaxis protein methyltransferase CheR